MASTPPVVAKRFSPENVKQGTPYRRPQQEFTSAGAITLLDGIVWISGSSALAMTIADPPVYMDGATLLIQSTTAQAHTVSNAAGSGFNSGGAASDVGTFGGAIGDNFSITAKGGKWLVNYLRNVTLA